MSYYIEKQQKIQDKVYTIYYEGNYSWTTIFENRKVYKYKKDATTDLYGFRGDIIPQ